MGLRMELRAVAVILVVIVILLSTMNFIMYQRVRGLEHEIATLKQSSNKVREVITGFEARVQSVEEQMNTYANMYADVKGEVDSVLPRIGELETRLSNVESGISDLASKVNELEGLNATVLSSIQELYTLYNDLLEKYRVLEEELENISTKLSTGHPSEIEDAVAGVQPWYFWYTDVLQSGEFIKKVLGEAVNTPTIYNIISEANIDPGEPLLMKIWKTINYTSLNLMYRRDSYVRVPLLYGGIRVWHDSLQLPNETVSEFSMGGDCEDLAILVYAVIEAVAKPSEEIYLLIAYAEPEGHVAVLAIDRDNGEAYIVDPSYSLVNGWAEMIEIEAINKTGVLEKRHLNPMAINPNLKKLMFTILKTKVAYVDAYTRITGGPKIVSYTPKTHTGEPRKILEIWRTCTGIQPTQYFIASKDYIKFFLNEEELITWIKQETSM